MKVTHDPQVDVLNIVFTEGPIDRSDEEGAGVVVDHDREGQIVALEILRASKRFPIPRLVEYSVAS